MVLIITQNEQVGCNLTRWLGNHEHSCFLATNGLRGLECALADTPSVIVLDLYLKAPSGLEVLQKLRAQGYSGKVILMGGPSVSPMIPEALHLGVDQVIGGESKLGPLECAIESALQSSVT